MPTPAHSLWKHRPDDWQSAPESRQEQREVSAAFAAGGLLLLLGGLGTGLRRRGSLS